MLVASSRCSISSVDPVTRLVARSDIVDYQTYEDSRSATRPAAMQAKALRRVHLGEELTLLFENRETLVYQIQEIMRAERIVRESDIAHEIETYNVLLGESGDLGAVLLLEIVDDAARVATLRSWVGLQARVYVVLADGSRVFAEFDAAQVGADRISAVQYLRFPVAGQTPVAVGTDFEGLESEVTLAADQVAALDQDLSR